MKYKKILVMLIAIVGLVGSVSSIGNVQAAPSRNHMSYWWHKEKGPHYRTERVKKATYAYKVHNVTPEYKDRFVQKKLLKPGQKIKVTVGGASWSWYLKKVPGTNIHSNAHYFWVVNKMNSKWMY